MAAFLLLAPFLLLSFALPLLDAASKEVTRGRSVTGVFLLMEGGSYAFNLTAAQAACLSLNVTMATMEQMERALQHGLETCKYGWIWEKIGVVPRMTSDARCGQGKTGVVTWRAQAQQPFGAFCYDAAAFQGSVGTSTAGSPTSAPLTSRTTTSPGTSLATSTPHTPTAPPPSRSTHPGRTDSPERSTLTSAPARPRKTAPSLRLSSTLPPPRYISSSSSFSSSSSSSSSPHVITSSPPLPSLTSSTSAEASSESVLLQSVSPGKQLGAVSVGLIILAVIFVILAAAGATHYYKLHVSPVWTQRQLKEDVEADTWRHNNSEMNLHRRHGALEEEEEEEEEEDGEEADRKYSSDIMLCVHPDMRTNCSQ